MAVRSRCQDLLAERGVTVDHFCVYRWVQRLVVAAGLVAMAAFYVWVAAATTATISYGIISVQMVLYGLGMGLTSAPATESIMGAVSRRQAGIGSAVNDSTRLLGGTLGVAVIGSVYASLYSSRLSGGLPALPGPILAIAHQSVGAAFAVSGKVSAPGSHRGQLSNTTRHVSLRSSPLGRGAAAGLKSHWPDQNQTVTVLSGQTFVGTLRSPGSQRRPVRQR
jgi:hypothetical protein